MRFLSIWRPAASNSGPPTQEHMQAMGALVQEMMANGSLIVTEPLGPLEAGARIESQGGRSTVSALTDRAGGYALIQAPSKEACMELMTRFFAVAGDGVCELRQIVDMAPPQG